MSGERLAREYGDACEAVGLPRDCPVERFVRHHRGNAGATGATQAYNEIVVRLKPLLQEALATDGEHHKQWFLERIAAELRLERTMPEHEPGVAP